MQLDEIAAEKLRALAQRQRPTDLSDLAMILRDNEIDKQQVRELATKKFELVKPGDRQSRIENNIQPLARNTTSRERRRARRSGLCDRTRARPAQPIRDAAMTGRRGQRSTGWPAPPRTAAERRKRSATI